MYRFAGAGLPGLRFLVSRLSADDVRVRAAAFQLLGTLTVRPLEFDPRSPKETRTKQVHSIEQELESVWVHMDWDESLRRFALPSRYPLPR
jgi:hypothetical protein